MTKSLWIITDENENVNTKLIYYHLGSAPKFPSWYMEENHCYCIELAFNLKLTVTIKTFLKCLFHTYVIK